MLHVLKNVRWFGYIVYYIDKGFIWKRSMLNWGGSFHMKIMKFGLLGYFCVLNWFLGGAKLKKMFNIFKMAPNPRWRPNGHHIENYAILKMYLMKISLAPPSNRFRMQNSPNMPSFIIFIWKLPPQLNFQINPLSIYFDLYEYNE